MADKNNTVLKLDIANYKRDDRRKYALGDFNIRENFCSAGEKEVINGRSFFSKLMNKAGLSAHKKVYTEKGIRFDVAVTTLKDNTYLDGYWQSEKYFKRIEKEVRAECVVKKPLTGINRLVAQKINSVNAVSIHVRRGDYITDPVIHAYHGVCSVDYYQRAIRYVETVMNDPYFFIFSDDMAWTKANLPLDGFPVEYIDHNTGVDYEDLRLMYLCRHHIIANSSFSWWGAWLSDSEDKKVVAPLQWFQTPVNTEDIIPGNWLKI